MVRTKISRAATKRGQNSSDSKLFVEMKLRDFDVIAECYLTNIDMVFQSDMDNLSRAFDVLRSRIPKNLLLLTMNELRGQHGGTEELNTSTPLNQTVSANMSALLEKSCRKKSKDDGYLTEESEHGDVYRPGSLMPPSKARYGPLMSARIRRRSKSSSAIVTPHTNRSMFALPQSAMAGKTMPLSSTLKSTAPTTERVSRARQKLSIGNRPKAVSADRGYGIITPKVLPCAALAMIRHAKQGESVFSLTGSPVVTANMLESTANVNIPVTNGMLSIRPTELTTVDETLLRKIDSNVLLELKQLQSNLDKIMNTLKLT